MGIQYELEVFDFAQLSNISQPKELHHTKSVGLGWEARKVEAPLSWVLLSWQQRILDLFWYLCWKQYRNFCCGQLPLGVEQWSPKCRWYTSESFFFLLCPSPAALWSRGREGGTVCGRIRVILWRVPFDPWSQQGGTMRFWTTWQWIAQVGNILIKAVHFLPFG